MWSRCSFTSRIRRSSSRRFAIHEGRSRADPCSRDLAREFGYARAKKGTGSAPAIGRGRGRHSPRSIPTWRPRGTARRCATTRRWSRTSSARCSCRPCSRRSRRSSSARPSGSSGIAGLDPAVGRQAPSAMRSSRPSPQEASDIAGQFLNICIRAIDYCPPADMEMGEYLRAMITADGDIERTDKYGFREALMRSFRRRLIFPDHVKFMTEEAVRWEPIGGPPEHPRPGVQRPAVRRRARAPGEREGLHRQALALGRFVTDQHARTFQLVAPSGTLPKGATQASPAVVGSPYVHPARRAGRRHPVRPRRRGHADLHGAAQAETPSRRTAGARSLIDPQEEVRYAIYKRFHGPQRGSSGASTGSDARTAKDFWARSGSTSRSGKAC